jgi:dihydroxyacetone kinase
VVFLKRFITLSASFVYIVYIMNQACLIPSYRLGATPVMELMIAARKAVPELQLEYGIAVDRVYTGTFMTALDMAG